MDAIYIIETVPLLLGILSGFVMGMMAGLGLAIVRLTRTDLSLAALDSILLALSLLAAFGLGVFISFALR